MNVILEAFIFGFKAAAIGLTGFAIIGGTIVGVTIIVDIISNLIGSEFVSNSLGIFFGVSILMTLLHLMAYSYNGGKL